MNEHEIGKAGSVPASPHTSTSLTADARVRLEDAGLTPITEDNADLGTALRKIYQQTVDESVPSEMLDLLNRLS